MVNNSTKSKKSFLKMSKNVAKKDKMNGKSKKKAIFITKPKEKDAIKESELRGKEKIKENEKVQVKEKIKVKKGKDAFDGNKRKEAEKQENNAIEKECITEKKKGEGLEDKFSIKCDFVLPQLLAHSERYRKESKRKDIDKMHEKRNEQNETVNSMNTSTEERKKELQKIKDDQFKGKEEQEDKKQIQQAEQENEEEKLTEKKNDNKCYKRKVGETKVKAPKVKHSNKKNKIKKKQKRKKIAEGKKFKQQMRQKFPILNRLPFRGYARKNTVSVALPSSIISNAQTPELKAYLVGAISRILTIFGVDEIVVYEDMSSAIDTPDGYSASLYFFVKNLQFLETPQYLRRALFEVDSDLRFSGLQNPIDSPHHLRKDEALPYREGVVIRASESAEKETTLFVNCGLPSLVRIPHTHTIANNTRVTVKFDDDLDILENKEKYLRGSVVTANEPRETLGIYWGYEVRYCKSLQEVLDDCPFGLAKDVSSRGVEDGGNTADAKLPEKIKTKTNAGNKYDLIIGTSERGDFINSDFKLPHFKHVLILFGGLKGLEEVLNDKQCNMPLRNPRDVCHMYLNTCAFQSSRTIRTEEALSTTLALLRPHILSIFRNPCI